MPALYTIFFKDCVQNAPALCDATRQSAKPVRAALVQTGVISPAFSESNQPLSHVEYAQAAPDFIAFQVLAGQVLNPKMAYDGHQPMNPVITGAMPTHPHMPMMSVAASPISTAPSQMRISRSQLPMFVRMLCS
jgi:hypothetical protein